MKHREIRKYQLQATRHQELLMPNKAVPICVKVYRGKVFVWAVVDPTANSVGHSVWLFGDNHEVDVCLDLQHIDSVQLESQALLAELAGEDATILHVFFEITPNVLFEVTDNR